MEKEEAEVGIEADPEEAVVEEAEKEELIDLVEDPEEEEEQEDNEKSHSHSKFNKFDEIAILFDICYHKHLVVLNYILIIF